MPDEPDLLSVLAVARETLALFQFCVYFPQFAAMAHRGSTLQTVFRDFSGTGPLLRAGVETMSDSDNSNGDDGSDYGKQQGHLWSMG